MVSTLPNIVIWMIVLMRITPFLSTPAVAGKQDSNRGGIDPCTLWSKMASTVVVEGFAPSRKIIFGKKNTLSLIPNHFADTNDSENLSLLIKQLALMSQSFLTAGELISDMACKLPNWYSSKEGLTGESPAVFGSCGMSFIQASDSISTNGIANASKTSLSSEESSSSTTKNTKAASSNLKLQLQYLSSDLASAACALDPIGISANLDLACEAIDNLIIECSDETDASSDSGSKGRVEQYCTQFAQALYGCCQDLQNYGDLLCAEDSKAIDDASSAGNILAQAGDGVRSAGDAFSLIPTQTLIEQLSKRSDSNE